MRILYVANPNTIHVQRWLSHFARAGHDVHLALVNTLLVPRDRFDGVTIHDLTLRSVPTRVSQLLEVPRLRRLLRELRPSILHAHYVARYGWLAALARFHPLVLTAWGGDVLPDQGAFDSRVARLLTPYTLRSADAITVDGIELAAICRREAGADARIESVTFGADLERFRPGLATDRLREQLAIPRGATVVLSSRTFAPVYNIDTIIESIPLVVTRCPDVVFVLQNYSSLSNSTYSQHLVDLVTRLNVADHVRFAGEFAHADMPLLYNLSQIALSVPSSDGVPATFFEAMGCEVPLIVSDLPAYDGLIDRGRNGVRVPVRNPQALADAIVSLVTSPERRQAIAMAALEVVREKGNFAREMARVAALYEELAKANVR